MPKLTAASPRLTVRLYKTISRQTIDGQTAVSARYAEKDEFIELTGFMGDGSSVRTTKSVREPAGAFTITFMDKAQGYVSLDSVYGLVEPMDVVEIRMWGGVGPTPASGKLPIVMRGFVSDVQRQQGMSPDGRPVRSVVITGQDYGKIWQIFQALYMPSYSEGKSLLTSFQLAELFGFKAVSAISAPEFVRLMITKIINPYIAGMLPESLSGDIPKKIQTSDASILVKHGMIGQHFQSEQGPIYEIMKRHTDVGHWNELYAEDREDGVHCVYRPIPALRLSGQSVAERKIQDDAPDPVYVLVPDGLGTSFGVSRSDSVVSNFYWVNGQKYDLIDDMSRRLFDLQFGKLANSGKDYPNTAVKYYGLRPMYADTQMSGDEIKNDQSGQPEGEQKQRNDRQYSWIEKRLKQLVEMNQDNVVFERGTARVKGGLMRPDGSELMKAGDYARFQVGRITWDAYVTQIDHEFTPYQSYTQTLTFERGEGFAKRTQAGGSPWLTEQARRI
jgi:hypothetical protein